MNRATSTPTDQRSTHAARDARPATAGPLLVATDGRHVASLVEVARMLATRVGAEAQIIAVNEPIPAYLPGIDMSGLPADLYAEERRRLLAVITSELESSGEGAKRWPIEVLDGTAARTIAQVAHDRHARLIIMGIGRHTPLDRVFGGETALRTIRLADRPVLAVAPGLHALPRHAVVAMDFSPASVRAAEEALAMLADGGHLSLVYVRPSDEILRRLGDSSVQWMHGERVTQLFERLTRALAAPAGVTVEPVVLAGDPTDQLLRYAESQPVELLATGRSGLGFFDRLIVGSVATRLIRRAPVSMLVVPRPSAAEVERIERALDERPATSGTTATSDAGRWPAMVEAFSERNAGRATNLEIDDPAIGAQLQQKGYLLVGASYDRHDRRLELMLRPAVEGAGHLTHTIGNITSIAVLADALERDIALQARHGDGQTILTFAP